MGKLKIFSGKKVYRVLALHGFEEVRRKGSHIVMHKRILESTITVPESNHNEIKIGTLMSIIRQSGIPRSEFE